MATNCSSQNSLPYNGTMCACMPGYFRIPSSQTCSAFNADDAQWRSEGGHDTDTLVRGRSSLFSFNDLNNFKQSQALFLEITMAVVALWLMLCILLRLAPLREGRSPWFRLRRLLSRLDVFFSTRHWIDEQKAVIKRRTELGGMFSIASLLLFIGLSTALVFQIISRRRVEVQNIRPANVPDLQNFVNDFEFNITTVSGMQCSQLRGLDSLRTGIMGSIDERTYHLGRFMNYQCYNTSSGPKISFRSSQYLLSNDDYYIPWHFVDIPAIPAAAVGFVFNLTAKKNSHLSVLSGAVNTTINDSPSTLRGDAANILQFRLVPRLIKKAHNLSLIQAFFHEFVPGSQLRTASDLQSSLNNPKDGLLNITFHLHFLSDYIVEVDTENVSGPVTFLANLGGLYAISIALFFYILVQCEYRVKRFRFEDYSLRKLEARQRARKNWDKLRRYVMYTWCSGGLDTSKYERYMSKGKDSRNFQKSTLKLSSKMKAAETAQSSSETLEKRAKTNFLEALEQGPRSKSSEINSKPEYVRKRESQSAGRLPPWILGRAQLPTVPEISSGEQMDISSMQSYIKSLYEYNVRLREDFLVAQSVLGDIVQRLSPHSDVCRECI